MVRSDYRKWFMGGGGGGEKIKALTETEAMQWIEDRDINPDDVAVQVDLIDPTAMSSVDKIIFKFDSA